MLIKKLVFVTAKEGGSVLTANQTKPLNGNREELVRLVRKWGDVNTDGLLEESCQIFLTPEIEGFIGYKIESSNAVVFGDPVCSLQDKPALAKKFQEYCASKGIGVVYTIVSKEFADWSFKNHSAITIEFGEKFILDPFNNPINNTGSKSVLVRKKVKQAGNAGLTVHEYSGDDPKIEQQIEDVASEWLQKRHGPQIYLSHVTLFKDRQGKRWFYAQSQGKIVAFLMLNELKEQNGWLLNNNMMTKKAPNGVSELLIINTLQELEKENCRFVLIGPVPGKQLGEINGIDGFSSTLTRWFFKGARFVFHLEGQAAFWDKFQPRSVGSYLVFPEKNLGYSSIKALLSAFNTGLG